MLSSKSYETTVVSNDTANPEADKRSNVDEGYVVINDMGVPRKRPLPMPPAFYPPRPRKKIPLCSQTCKELCSYCVGSRLILSLPLLVLAAISSGVVIYLLVTNIKAPPPTPPPNVTQTTEKPDDGVPTGSNGSLKFIMSNVQNPETLNLLQESMGQNVAILQNVKLNFTNKTWSFDGRNVWIAKSNIDTVYSEIALNMEISDTQCKHSGKYTVLISGNNSKAEQSLFYKVKAACPCESEYELNSNKVLTCKFKVVGNTTVRLDKVRGEIAEPILYQTGLRIPDNVPERGRFSAQWSSNGMLTVTISFSPVRCHDEGNYTLTVTSRGGTQIHYMHVKVIDHPVEPSIRIQSDLIEGKENALQCLASTFCTNASLIVEATRETGSGYFLLAENLTTTHYQENYSWKANATMILTEYIALHILRNRCVRCKYLFEGRTYYSQPLCIQIIPDDFCRNRKPTCRYRHPFDCSKYITCNIDPAVSICPAGLQYPQNSDSCTGDCVYANEANCTMGIFDGCQC